MQSRLLCRNYLYGGIFGRKKDEDAEVSLGSTARGSIFRDTGGGIRIDQNAGNCIGQFLLDHNGIVCGRGDTGRNVRVKYRNGQEFTVFEKKSFYKCQIHDIMSKNELRVCMFIYTLASIGALKS